MLDNLIQRLTHVVKTMYSEARLTETDTAEMLREVRLALFEADVALPVMREFIAHVKGKALSEDVIMSPSPDQALINVVQRELTAIIDGQETLKGVDSNIIGGRAVELDLDATSLAITPMAGLQDTGKTTTVGKPVEWLGENKEKKVLTMPYDVYRPITIAQLKIVSEQVDVDFFPSQPDQRPVDIVAVVLDWTREHYHGVLTADTAGCFGIDEAMMQEIAAPHTKLKPAEALLVVDAIFSQSAVNTVRVFNGTLPLTSAVLTKLNGGTRGSAALPVHYITGKPVRLVDVAEKLDELGSFYPDRMAQWILDMGDILALVEKAQRGVGMEKMQKLVAKTKKAGSFDLEDLKTQIGQMKKMGGPDSLIGKLPTQLAQRAQGANTNQVEKQVRRAGDITNSIAVAERVKPEPIEASRKRRIVTGADVQVQEIDRLLNQFEQV